MALIVNDGGDAIYGYEQGRTGPSALISQVVEMKISRKGAMDDNVHIGKFSDVMAMPHNNQVAPRQAPNVPEFHDANNFSTDEMNRPVDRMDFYKHSNIKSMDKDKYVIEGHLTAFIDQIAAITVNSSSEPRDPFETDSDTQSSDPESVENVAPPPPRPANSVYSAPPPPRPTSNAVFSAPPPPRPRRISDSGFSAAPPPPRPQAEFSAPPPPRPKNDAIVEKFDPFEVSPPRQKPKEKFDPFEATPPASPQNKQRKSILKKGLRRTPSNNSIKFEGNAQVYVYEQEAADYDLGPTQPTMVNINGQIIMLEPGQQIVTNEWGQQFIVQAPPQAQAMHPQAMHPQAMGPNMGQGPPGWGAPQNQLPVDGQGYAPNGSAPPQYQQQPQQQYQQPQQYQQQFQQPPQYPQQPGSGQRYGQAMPPHGSTPGPQQPPGFVPPGMGQQQLPNQQQQQHYMNPNAQAQQQFPQQQYPGSPGSPGSPQHPQPGPQQAYPGAAQQPGMGQQQGPGMVHPGMGQAHPGMMPAHPGQAPQQYAQQYGHPQARRQMQYGQQPAHPQQYGMAGPGQARVPGQQGGEVYY